jgi:hypothetical protein
MLRSRRGAEDIVGGCSPEPPAYGLFTRRGQNLTASGVKVGKQAMMIPRLISKVVQVTRPTAVREGSPLARMLAKTLKRIADTTQRLQTD